VNGRRGDVERKDVERKDVEKGRGKMWRREDFRLIL
jgi:hypothetical protein